jgi:hypothetical protein
MILNTFCLSPLPQVITFPENEVAQIMPNFQGYYAIKETNGCRNASRPQSAGDEIRAVGL